MASARFTLRAAVYLILLNGNKILLSRRFNTGWMDGKYSLIAGHFDGSEPVSAVMIREAWEEAGIRLAKKDLVPGTVIHRKSDDQEYIDFFYVARKWKGTVAIKEPDKCDELSWFPLNKLPNNVLPYIKEALRNFKLKTAFSEFGWD